MIKTVTLSGKELKADNLGGFNTIVHNLSDSEVYASKYPNIEAGADNVAEIPAGAAKLISTTNGTIYLIGTGKVELTGQDHDSVNFSQPSSMKSGGGTGNLTKEYVDKQDSVNLDAAKEHADTQINAVEKCISDLQTNKADKSEIPTTLPANGGNADTVNGHTVKSDVPEGAKFTDTVYKHPATSGSKHIPSGGKSGQILRWSADGTAVWGADSNTTYSAMTGATASAAGKTGLVPAPAAGKQEKYLRGDGTWQTPPDTNTTYSNATTSAAGLMSASDKTKLNGIATSANNYTHPTTAGNKHIPSGGSTNQILTYSAAGTARWSSNCYASAIAVNSGNSVHNVTVAYKTGRTKALLLFYHTGAVGNLSNMTFGRVSLTGLSDNMTAKPQTSIMSGPSCQAMYSVSANGDINLDGSSAVGYIVIWFN